MLIVEIGTDPAVGFAGRILRSLGDTVVKLEFLPDADPVRARPPVYHAEGRRNPAGVLFHYLHQGKRSIAVDPVSPAGRRLVGDLADAADAVLVDGGVLALPPVASLVDGLRSDIVTVVTPFGTQGPHAECAETSATVFAMSGEASMLPGGMGFERFPDDPPLLARGHVADGDAGVIASLVTLAGLYAREEIENGMTFDVAKQECQVSLNRWLVTHYRLSGWIESRATRAYAYGGLVECRNGFVMLQPTTDGHWKALVEMMGNPSWADDPRFETQEGRTEAGATIQEHLVAWSRTQIKEEIFSAGVRLGVPVAPFRDMSDVAGCPQYRARDFFVPYGARHREVQRELPGLPFRPHPETRTMQAPAPDLGQDTVGILTEALGLSEPEVRRLVDEGAVLVAEAP